MWNWSLWTSRHNSIIFFMSCSFLKAMSLNGYAMPWRLLALISLPAARHCHCLKIKSYRRYAGWGKLILILTSKKRTWNLTSDKTVQHKFCSSFMCCSIGGLFSIKDFFSYFLCTSQHMYLYINFNWGIEDKKNLVDGGS